MLSIPPESTDLLLQRARSLAGLRIGHIAESQGKTVPSQLNRHKGWIGRLLEDALGADGGNARAADFGHLGVELKTIPVTAEGRPRETTFVGSVELAAPDEITWETSSTRAKLSRVLWIPILATPNLPIAHRMIGTPLLWSPSPSEEESLARDWNSHMAVIRQGYVEHITAHDGEVLQIRPKGANAQSRTWSIDADGEAILTAPRAFYLRTSFTGAILRRNFALVY